MSNSNDESSMQRDLQVDQLQEELARQTKLYKLEQLQSHILQRQMLLLTAATQRTSSKDVQHILTSDSTYIRSNAARSTPVSPNVLTYGRSHPMNISWPQSAPTNGTHNQAQLNTHSLVSAYSSRTSDTLNSQYTPQSPVDDSPSRSTLASFPVKGRKRVKRTSDVSERERNGGKAGTSSRKRVAPLDSRQPLTLDTGMRAASPGPKLNSGGVLRTSTPADLDMLPPASSSPLPLSLHDDYSQSQSIPGRTADDSMLSNPPTLHGQQQLPSGSPSSGTSNAAASTTSTWSSLTPAILSELMKMNNPSLNTSPAPTMLGGGENRPCDTSTASTSEAQRLPSTTQKQPVEDLMVPMDPSAPDAAVITTTTHLSTSKPPRGTATTPSNPSTSTQNDSSLSSHLVLKVNSTPKDSEQKRRDLLKESFDELRLLLPSISLSLSANDGPLAGLGLGEGDPPLPGAKPPRGDEEVLNKGVSKLVLLECANKFIQDLIAQVARKDKEVGRLRDELKRLRATLGIVVLERDLEKEDEEFREERRHARKKKRDEDREQASANQRAA